MTKTKFEAMDILNKYDIPCGPILSMKEIAEEPSLRETGTVVEVDHPTRGKYLTVGNPIKMSDSPSEVKRSPLLGEHTEEILRERAAVRRQDQIAAMRGEQAHLTARSRSHDRRSSSPRAPVSRARRRDRYRHGRGSSMAQDKNAVRKVLDKAKAERRDSLTAPEGKLVCDAYGITVPKEGVARSAQRGGDAGRGHGLPRGAQDRLAGHPAQDRGRRRAGRRQERRRGRARATTRIIANAKKYNAKAKIIGVQVQQMLQRRPGGDHRRRHRSELRQAGRVRPRRRPGRGAEGHHLPPRAGDPGRRALDARRHRGGRDAEGRARRRAGQPRRAGEPDPERLAARSATSRRSPRWI